MAGQVNTGRKLYISTTPEPDDMLDTDYVGATWIEVKNVVSVGETGSSPNVLSQSYWGTSVLQKQTGILDAGDPTVELGTDYSDPGMIALLSIANDGQYYPIKIEDRLKANETTPGTSYNRGLVLGPVTNNGGAEDWNNTVFTFGLVQEQIVEQGS